MTARRSVRALAAALSLAAVPVLALAQTTPLPAQLIAKAKAAVDADATRLVGIYKDMHQNPELGFMEVRTTGLVAKELTALGFDVKTGIGQTGVVGVLRNGPGPAVMHRADMDANAVVEATGLPYASKVRAKLPDGAEAPVAHMCVHDAHVTWMLGMARAMVAMTADWSGTMTLIGRPAEETITGAKAMVDDGRWTRHGLPKLDFCIGMHTAPGPLGRVVSSGGPKMAGTGQIDILFKGVGGHGSTPLVNDVALAKRLAVPLRGALGDQGVVTVFPPATGSEDVHLLLGPHAGAVPFTYLIVGVADPAVFAAAKKEGKRVPYSAHNSNFVVDLKAIPIGAQIATVAMLELMAKKAPQ